MINLTSIRYKANNITKETGVVCSLYNYLIKKLTGKNKLGILIDLWDADVEYEVRKLGKNYYEIRIPFGDNIDTDDLIKSNILYTNIIRETLLNLNKTYNIYSVEMIDGIYHEILDRKFHFKIPILTSKCIIQKVKYTCSIYSDTSELRCQNIIAEISCEENTICTIPIIRLYPNSDLYFKQLFNKIVVIDDQIVIVGKDEIHQIFLDITNGLVSKIESVRMFGKLSMLEGMNSEILLSSKLENM